MKSKGFVSLKQKDYIEKNHPELVAEMTAATSDISKLPDHSANQLKLNLKKDISKVLPMFSNKKKGMFNG